MAAWGNANVEPPPGRLTADLEPLGFDGLAVLLEGKKLAPGNVLQFRRAPEKKPAQEDAAAARAKAREAIKAAEKALTAARHDAERTEAALATATARAEALEQQRREIADRCDQAQADVRTASKDAKKAAQAVAEAERVLARAGAANQ
jgi:septal ring factor EnvC (AmiA/AmiB activator)